MLRKLIAMLVKVFNPSYIGMYSACKSHVFERNQLREIPKTSILATTTYERRFKRENDNYEEE